MNTADDRASTGRTGEQIACDFLTNRGYTILERNYRKPWGEIDIIAEIRGVVHFVEVKAVSVRDFSREKEYIPEEMVHVKKLRKIVRTAELFMISRNDAREFQVDVIGVLLLKEKRVARCRFFQQVLG